MGLLPDLEICPVCKNEVLRRSYDHELFILNGVVVCSGKINKEGA